MNTIPGTANLPDHALHRASLWIEAIKQAGMIDTETDDLVQVADDEYLSLVLTATDAGITAQQLQEAALFYGRNMLRMCMLGGANAPSMAVSAWADGVLHGLALARGLTADHDPTWRSVP